MEKNRAVGAVFIKQSAMNVSMCPPVADFFHTRHSGGLSGGAQKLQKIVPNKRG